jgi:hypothetical protein
MSFQDVGKPGAPKPPQRSHLTAQPNIPEGRPSSSLPKTGDPFAQLSDGILQYQVKKCCCMVLIVLEGTLESESEGYRHSPACSVLFSAM